MNPQQRETEEIAISGRQAAGVIAALVVVAAVFLSLSGENEAPSNPVEQNTPQYTRYSDESVDVNETYIIRGSGYVDDPTDFQVLYGSYATELSLFGIYNGRRFFWGRYPEEGAPDMRLSKKLTPGNGIIEGFMIGRMVGPKDAPVLNVTIFIDEEFWAATEGTIWKVWGENLEHRQRATFTPISEGVYRDTLIENDTRRFLPGVSPSNARIYVGRFDLSTDPPRLTDQSIGMYLD